MPPIYKIVYYYSANKKLEPPNRYSTHQEAWDEVRKALVLPDPTLQSVEVIEVTPQLLIVGYRKGETWKSIYSVPLTLDHARSLVEGGENPEWSSLTIYQEVIPDGN